MALIVGYFDDERIVALQFSTDGVQLFRNSTCEAWPLLIINLNLPPEDRYFLPCLSLIVDIQRTTFSRSD